MSLERKSKLNTGVIVAFSLAMVYLIAIAAAVSGPPHPEPHYADRGHPHFVSNPGPMKHPLRPGPWMIGATGWVVSVVSHLS